MANYEITLAHGETRYVVGVHTEPELDGGMWVFKNEDDSILASYGKNAVAGWRVILGSEMDARSAGNNYNNKESVKMGNNYAVVCLDETGSMTGQEERVVTSMNEYVNHIPDGTHLSVFKFDSVRWTKFFDDTKDNWKQMTLDDYSPGAATPLYDRVYDTIAHAESLAKNPEDKVMIMVDTDGWENASIEYNQESINALVEKKKALGWEFWFMANALDQKGADTLGNLGKMMGMNVSSNAYSKRLAAYRAAASNTISYFSGTDNNQEFNVSGSRDRSSKS